MEEVTSDLCVERRILILGYGNPGRRDDGLGPEFASRVADLALGGVQVDADYQLTVEDACEVAGSRAVIFVDASISGTEPFGFSSIEPASAVTFSTHSISPEGVLALARDLFSRTPPGFVLSIRGYEFDEFGEGLSDGAEANLSKALEFIQGRVLELQRENGNIVSC